MNQIVNEGDTASFTCQATGEPVPTISWYFNGIPVDEANRMKYIISIMSLNTTTNSSTLTIMNVQSSDVGTYTCNATNAVSTNTSSGVLTVNGELFTGKTPCKYGPIFALYLYRIESNRVNTVQKQVRIYTAFFLWLLLYILIPLMIL